MRISTGVARIFQQGGQSEGAKRPSGGGGVVPPSHGREIFENSCMKTEFYCTLNAIRGSLCSGIYQFPTLFILLADQQEAMAPCAPLPELGQWELSLTTARIRRSRYDKALLGALVRYWMIDKKVGVLLDWGWLTLKTVPYFFFLGGGGVFSSSFLPFCLDRPAPTTSYRPPTHENPTGPTGKCPCCQMASPPLSMHRYPLILWKLVGGGGCRSYCCMPWYDATVVECYW